MKYNIVINQLVLAETDLNLIDAAILDYIIWICLSTNAKVEKQRKEGFTWINYKHLLAEMPLLRIKSISAITSRLKSIKKAGFIDILKKEHQRVYIKLTEKIDSLFTNMNSTVLQKEQGTVLQKEPIIILDNNNTTKINSISEENMKLIKALYIIYKKRIYKTAKLTEPAKKKINSRLKEYSAKEIAKAIKLFSSNIWRMENNANKGMLWFFRSEEQIAIFLSLRADRQPANYTEDE